MKTINSKYKVSVVRIDGNLLYNNGNDYFVQTGYVCGIHIFNILNNEEFKDFEIIEIEGVIDIPKDLILKMYSEVDMRKAYFQGHLSGLNKSQKTFSQVLKAINDN